MSKRYSIGLLVLLCGMILAGCGQNTKKVTKNQDKEECVKIPITFLIDAATNEKNNEELVSAFNKKYTGKYEIDVEWEQYTSGEYRSNLKRWNVEEELPSIITDVCFLPSFYQLMINDERLVDLAPYIDEDKEWKEAFDEEVLEACREEDGSFYVCPLGSNCFSYSGIFYNKDMLKKAGYDTFPTTWDEFFECCEALKKEEITPLGLHTSGTAWTTMLFATAYLGQSEEGQAFMKQRLPESYDTKEIRDMVEMLQKLYTYGDIKGMYQDFDVPYRQFVNEEVAMLPNGFWMLLQFHDEWTEKIGFAPFPGNVMIASPQSSSWGIVSSYPGEIREGAVEFLKFRTLETRKQVEQFLNHKEKDRTSLEQDYINAVNQKITVIPNYQLQWNPILQYEVLGEDLPKFLQHTIDPEGFVQAMNESVIKYQEEQ